MEAPKCCKKPMELKAAVTWTSTTNYPLYGTNVTMIYNNTLILIYQCKKCGKVITENIPGGN